MTEIMVNYKSFGECAVRFEMYGNLQKAIQLYGTKGEYRGQLISTATVSTAHEIGENQVMIKNYSENEGVYEALHAAGVISEAVSTVQIGYAFGLVCDLLVPFEIAI